MTSLSSDNEKENKGDSINLGSSIAHHNTLESRVPNSNDSKIMDMMSSNSIAIDDRIPGRIVRK